MKINLAQALKEKNRLAGEITNMWNLVQRENSCWENHTRCIDIRETLETIGTYTEKLIELKTKIGKANKDNLENMYSLEELKSKISKLDGINTEEDVKYIGMQETIKMVRTVEIQESEILKMKKELQIECNRLQDALDSYNVRTTIEFDTPLK